MFWVYFVLVYFLISCIFSACFCLFLKKQHKHAVKMSKKVLWNYVNRPGEWKVRYNELEAAHILVEYAPSSQTLAKFLEKSKISISISETNTNVLYA